jgi:predicted Mrr-cat superfamily restriction endonuclease
MYMYMFISIFSIYKCICIYNHTKNKYEIGIITESDFEHEVSDDAFL